MQVYRVEVYNNGDQFWKNEEGLLHRLDGPAVEHADGSKEWCIDGKYHRTDGPAVEYADGYKAWYFDGKQLSEKEFLKRTKNDCDARVIVIDGIEYEQENAMEQAFRQMAARCDRLVEMMVERGFSSPRTYIRTDNGETTACVGLTWEDGFKFITSETVAGAFAETEAWILGQPAAAERAKQDALELVAKAFDAVRDAFLTAGEPQ